MLAGDDRALIGEGSGERAIFVIGDYFAGAVVGAATGLAVHAVVRPGFDLALAMLVGIGLGTLVHLAIGLVLSPLLGMFHVMVPGSLIGMYGGMLFGMRDAMQPTPMSRVVAVGVLFGVLMTAGVRFYDRAIAGTPARREG